MYYMTYTASKANVPDVSSVVTVYVSSSTVPIPQFSILTPSTGKLNTNKTISLVGSDNTQGGYIDEVTGWSWSVTPYLYLDSSVLVDGLNNKQDLRFKADVLVPDTVYTFTLRAKTAQSEWGMTNVKITTNSPPHSGRLDISPTSGLISLETAVTFSASNWVDTISDQPLQYRFGYQLGNATTILREFSTLPSLTTSSLPTGTLQPIIWVRDTYGATREARYGCLTYKINGVWATETECPSSQYLTVSPPVLTGNHTFTSLMSEKISSFSLSQSGPTKAVLLISSAATNANQDSTTMCDSSCELSGSALRLQMYDLLDAAIATNQILANALLLSTTATISSKTNFLENTTTRERTNSLFDKLLTQGVTEGMDLTAGESAIEILSSVTTATKAVSNGLTNSTADKILSQAKSISTALLKSVAKNEPVVSISKLGVDGRTMLEVGGKRVSKSAMLGSTVSMENVQAVIPTVDFTAHASSGGSGRRLLSTNEEYQIQMLFFSEEVNPYAYDTSHTVQSGVTSVSFSDGSGNPLTVSGLTQGSTALKIGVKLNVDSPSPKCMYRDKSGDAYSASGVSSYALSDEPAMSPSGQFVLCETTHLSDFVMVNGCDAVTDCNNHGLCAQDSTCRCTCGWMTHNCSEVHIGNWADPSKNRFFSDGAFKLAIDNDAVGGRVALVKQTSGTPTCAGAGAAPLASFDGNASKIAVVGTSSFGYGVLPTSTAGGTPLSAGQYTVCTCNAEKANDPVYSNCDTDCSYHVQAGGTFTVVDTPRVGPLLDFGDTRMVSNVSTTFRITAGLDTNTALVNGDKVYVAADCTAGPATTPEIDRSEALPLSMLGSSFSTSVKVPALLTSSALHLKWCFTTIEMGASPANSEYAELPDSLTVIQKPRMAGGIDISAITHTSPDFILSPASGSGAWGVDGGDYVFLRDVAAGTFCETLPTAATLSETLAIRTSQYNNDAIGPVCGSGTAINVEGIKYAAYSQMPSCGVLSVEAELESDLAWCPASLGEGNAREGSLPPTYYLGNSDGPYLQLDAGNTMHVYAIESQGHGDIELQWWVKQYAISTSVDGIVWNDHVDSAGLLILQGNLDYKNKVKT